jgi:hypothetical protein
VKDGSTIGIECIEFYGIYHQHVLQYKIMRILLKIQAKNYQLGSDNKKRGGGQIYEKSQTCIKT